MAECLQETVGDSLCPVDAKIELLHECEHIWKLLEERKNQIPLLESETPLELNPKLSLLMTRVRALSAECHQWEDRCLEKRLDCFGADKMIGMHFRQQMVISNTSSFGKTVISTNLDLLEELGKQEPWKKDQIKNVLGVALQYMDWTLLQKVENDLEMVLSTIESKNRQLEKDLKREQKWLEEQEQMLDFLNRIEEETKAQAEKISQKSFKNDSIVELQKKMLKLKTFKKDLLNTMSEFLAEHFPHPNKDAIAKNKFFLQNSSEQSAELIALHEIVENLVSKSMNTPHEPYVTINDSFWTPYIELLLRYGVALRHPEDPNRIRLEAFHM